MAKGSRNGAAQPTGCWIRKEKRVAIYLRDRFCCLYCGCDLHDARPFEVTLDHLKPQSRGGTNAESNVVTACRTCNCSRKDRPWTQFATGGAVDRIRRHRRRALNLDLARALINGDTDWPTIQSNGCNPGAAD